MCSSDKSCHFLFILSVHLKCKIQTLCFPYDDVCTIVIFPQKCLKPFPKQKDANEVIDIDGLENSRGNYNPEFQFYFHCLKCIIT